ncbi:hypothetical protein L211DRAFT_286738 [Terfezia boudieri ATCC MYA-4762]|uniref:Uncharacterized protein n=1 Tax=Terfezia boudieri ATCC MYA-4762 TaxID=1051890 RepID=A0A3N4LZ73_9PEZI|nr:hypothetical protein L211DRAFT_286738 [Terfezia boudieri ATCC MYA-4762]
MSPPTSPSTSPRTELRDGVIPDTDTDISPDGKSQRRTASDSGKSLSGTCEDTLDVEDTKAKAARELVSGVSKGGAGRTGKSGGVKQITDSANLSLEGLMGELGTSFGGGSPSPTLSPGSSRAQSPGAVTTTTTTSTSPISNLSGVTGAQDGPNSLFSLSQLTPAQQETNTTAAAPFLPGGLAKNNNNNATSPTPSLCGSKFTPLKRVKKGPASVSNNQPATPGDVHTHTKRPSITSGTTEVASTSPGAIDAADYGIHGKKLATMFSNPVPGTPPSHSVESTEVTPDLVLLHISLIIPPNSSPAYARHQRKMLRRKRLDDESSTLSVSDLGYSDENATGDDADSDNLEPGPLSMLSPVVYQRGILIPHPRGDYVLLQREVGKTLGLPFVNGEDGENVVTDEFGGVQGKGWQMRVYARNGWLTKGAWERAWREMERVDVEILETERTSGKQTKPKARKTKTKQIQGMNSESGLGSRSGSFLRDGYAGLAGQSRHFPPASGDASGDVVYSDPEDSLDGDLAADNLEVHDNDAIRQGHSSIYEDGSAADADTGEKDDNNFEHSDVEDIERGDATPIFPRGVKRAQLQLENGTVGDGELEEAYRAHGENLDDPVIDEEYANDAIDLQDTPPSLSGSTKEPYLVPHSRSSSQAGSKGSQVRGKSPNPRTEGKRQVHPYQYILDLLKPIVLTGLVVTGAMYFFGPTHKRNGRYGSWNMRNGKQIHVDEENFDMDQDVEDHCAGYAREAEMWRSWKDSHKDGGSSSGAMLKKGVHGDWTVTVTQTVTQRIVNAGATQIVVEIPSGEAQFPLGPLLSERETQDSEELPLETATDGLPAIPLPTTTTDGSATGAELKAVDGEALVGEDSSKLDAASDSRDNTEREDAEGSVDSEEAPMEDTNTGGKWFGKIGKIF